MTDTETERPLVTFALFAYNQEKYIREAVEGAFSQTYEPLEIILSDDCSSDRTFEIMQEMAAEYKGPHRVVVRRSERNRGLGLHMRDVVLLVQTKYIVIAAGDDISLPQRTLEMISMMRASGSRFSGSCYNRMTDNGYIEAYNIIDDYSNHYTWKIVNYDSSIFVGGASAVYEADFLRSAFDAAADVFAAGYIFYEDILVALYAVATDVKPSKYNKEALVNYRINPTSLVNFIGGRHAFGSELSVVRREAFRSRTRLAVLDAAIEIAEKYPRLGQYLNRDRIAVCRRQAMIEISASERRFLTRLRGLFVSRDRQEVLLRLVRLPGPWFHAATRFMFSAFRKA